MKVKDLIEKLQQFNPEDTVAVETRSISGDIQYYVYKTDPRLVEGIVLTEGFWPNTGWTMTKNTSAVSLNTLFGSTSEPV